MIGARVPYSWSLLRAVPHPYTGVGAPVGVVLQSRPAEFIGILVVTDVDRLSRLAPDVDVELLARYLRSCEAIANGDVSGGEIALLSAPERFHWLTAPRSDVIQPSAVQHGVTEDPMATLATLFALHVTETEG